MHYALGAGTHRGCGCRGPHSVGPGSALSSSQRCAHTPWAPTWIFMATSRPPFKRARCTCPMEAAAKGRSSKYSSLSRQLGPRSLLRVFWRERPGRSCEHSWGAPTPTHRTATPQPRSPGLTIICFSGMKSALCLTRSKILARWGLMKASSGRQQSRQQSADPLEGGRAGHLHHPAQRSLLGGGPVLLRPSTH